MSLLMKALKQAEQRHQQAAAEALERSAAESVSGGYTGIGDRIDAGMEAEAGSGTARRTRTAEAGESPSAPRARSRRSGGTPLALEEARDALDDAATDASADPGRAAAGHHDDRTAAASEPLEPADTAYRSSSARTTSDSPNTRPPEAPEPSSRRGSARSPAYAELTLANDQPPTISAADDSRPGQAAVSRQIPRRAGDPSPAQAAADRSMAMAPAAADRSMATTPATATSSREAASFPAARDGAAPRSADGAFDGNARVAPGSPQIAPAPHLQPRVRRSSPRNRRIGLWAGVGTAVVVTVAWFGWQLLAPPAPLASAGVPPLQTLPPAAAPAQGEASPTSAAVPAASAHPSAADLSAAAPSAAVPSAAAPSAAAPSAAIASPAAASQTNVATTAVTAATVTNDPAARPSGAAPLTGATARSGVGTPPASDVRLEPVPAAPAAPAAPAVTRVPRNVAARTPTGAPVATGETDVSPRMVDAPPRATDARPRALASEPSARAAEPAARTAEPSARPATSTSRTDSAPSGRPGTVRLVRSDEGERMARMLESAYTALQTRDIEAARAIYEQVLALDPNNTDALAGLATYSARAGNPLQAERLFNQVLAIDPNDQAARAGLVALRTSGDPAGQESQLRHLIAQDDSQPALHYALGNVLAAQGRWAEAQQSYFIATAGDAEQPDYAYNLAVSLERLKQPRAAATHYRRALELAVSRPARFPIDRARARLTALDGAARQGD